MSSREGWPDEGHYANYFEVGHSDFELVIDFGQQYADEPATDPEVLFHTRIIMTPVHARLLLDTLRRSIEDGDGDQSHG